MFWQRRIGASVCAALLTFCPLAQTVQAQDIGSSQGSVRISAADAPALAEQLMRAGQPEAARQIVVVLIEAAPDASDLHLLHARTLIRLNDLTAARHAARTAWRTAETQRQKFAAAFTMADVLAADEAYTRSQLWIRRAVQVAPNAQAEQVAVDAFRRVRQANPLAIEMRLGATPSDNVNSGNSNERISFAYLPGYLGSIQWTVPANQRPLSGIEFSLQTDLRYRIAETDRSRTSLEFGVYGRTFLMSDSAQASAPEVTGESLSYGQISSGVLHQWVGPQSDQPISASLTYTHAWAGGDPYRQQLNATLGTRYVLENEDEISISGGIGWTDRFAASDDVLTYSLRGRWSRELANDHVVAVTGGLSVATSDATDQAYNDASLSLGYDFGEIGAGVDLSATWTEQFRVYETSVFDPAGREDVSRSLRLEVGFQKIEFYGFEPVVNLTARRTDSSVPRFDTEGVQIGFNLRSSF